MKISQKTGLARAEKLKNYYNDAPPLFAIPRPFEDDYQRNNVSFKELLKLEKKSQQPKNKLEKYSVKRRQNRGFESREPEHLT